jgi:uncharacterized protein
MALPTITKIFSNLFSSGWIADELDVLWHAGEPLVLPTSYYSEAFREIQRLTPRRTKIQHCFQTNGMFINDDWCQLFKTYEAKVGVSIDGPEHINTAHRVARSGAPTFSEALAGVQCLRRNNVDFSILSVLTSSSLKHAKELYEFYQSEGIRSVCFNVEEIEGSNTSSSLSGDGKEQEFESFMREFWNLNVGSGALYYVREFDQMLKYIICPEDAEIYNTLSQPFATLSIDCKGNYTTFSPEFLGHKNDRYNDFIIGNVWKNSFEDALNSESFRVLSRDVAKGVELCRASCEYFSVCGGGSPVNKLYENGSIVSTETMCCRLHVKVMADLATDIIENSAKVPETGRAAEPDLVILGAGMVCPEHLTLETLRMLRTCDRIYTNVTEQDLARLDEDIRVKCVSLWPLYRDGRPRLQNYADVESTISGAVQDGGRVGYLTQGHPRVFDTVAEKLVQAGRGRGWNVAVLPAVSSLDTLLTEIGYDPANGLFVHEAAGLVAERISLVPSVATFLLQPCVFGSEFTHIASPHRELDLRPLRNYLLSYYRPEQRCAFIRSAIRSGERHQVLWIQLRNLASTSYEAIAGSTLFLPPADRECPHESGRAERTRVAATERDGSQCDPPSEGWSAIWLRADGDRIVICNCNDDSGQDRLQVNRGTREASITFGKNAYEAAARIPDAGWRSPTTQERQLNSISEGSRQTGNAIGVVRLPPTLLEPFRVLRAAASAVWRVEEIEHLLNAPDSEEGVRLVADYVKRKFQKPGMHTEMEGGICAKSPGLMTLSVQSETSKFVGLHVDDWYSFPLQRRSFAPNRICVNIGSEDRFLLYLDLPIERIHKELRRLGTGAPPDADGTGIARVFMSLLPRYPVNRLRIHPGEAYIAPTENIVHDASTIEMATIDLSLQLRGQFELSTVGPV